MKYYKGKYTTVIINTADIMQKGFPVLQDEFAAHSGLLGEINFYSAVPFSEDNLISYILHMLEVVGDIDLL